MELKFGVLADYAGQGAAGKVILVGIFDTIFDALRVVPIPMPQFFLFAAMEAHVTEGTDHTAVVHLTTADGADLPNPIRLELPFKFGARGRGRKMVGNLVIAVPPGLGLPARGAYEFSILLDGHHVGSIPLYVDEAQQTFPT
jgi:hypothetical protein